MQAWAEATDEELLRAHLAGDRFAFTEIVTRHQRMMWNVARRSLADERDAAEVVQDALVHAHQAAARFRADSSVRTWLMHILLNCCRDRYRRNRRRPEQPTDADILALVPEQRDGHEDRERAMDVQALLLRLPFEQRIVLVLVGMLGYTERDASIALGVPVGTLKSRGGRARKRLRELLDEDRSAAEPQLAGEGA
jgi:RNA polymerase sigma-70 factor (ECF subfamily)